MRVSLFFALLSLRPHDPAVRKRLAFDLIAIDKKMRHGMTTIKVGRSSLRPSKRTGLGNGLDHVGGNADIILDRFMRRFADSQVRLLFRSERV
jgi:hypothetical protein